MSDDKIEALRLQILDEQARSSIYSLEFRAWYAAYPRHRAPGDAWKAWRNVRHRPTLETLVAALDWQRERPEWQRDNGVWVPYPATYLRGRCWEDLPPQKPRPVVDREPDRVQPPEIQPTRSGRDDSEIRQDFARIFPGDEWPGYKEAFRRIMSEAHKREVFTP